MNIVELTRNCALELPGMMGWRRAEVWHWTWVRRHMTANCGVHLLPGDSQFGSWHGRDGKQDKSKALSFQEGMCGVWETSWN